MKKIKYLYFCEDLAHRIFLDHFLEQVTGYLSLNGSVQFVKPETYDSAGFMFKNYNHNQIKHTYFDVAQKAISDHRLDIFVVGLDLESSAENQFISLHDELYSNLLADKDKTIIYLSVQCIEHWLWYLKLKKENPENTKSLQLETQLRTKAKEVIYGKAKVSNEKAAPILAELLTTIDFDYLNQQSYSFRNLLGKIEQYIARVQ